MADTFAALTTLAVGERSFVMARLDALASEVDVTYACVAALHGDSAPSLLPLPSPAIKLARA